MDERNGLDRLTEREKECLRLWLQHRTAKEIAIDLGISHHAVEKRLKMARIKLDAGSSLEAARMLGEAEGYGVTGPHAPEVAEQTAEEQVWLTRPLTLGVLAMTILAAILLAYAAQSGSVGGEPSTVPETGTSEPAGYLSASATPEQVEAYVQDQFARFDRDGSGVIERSEGPRQITVGGCCGVPKEEFTGEAAWQRFLSDNHDDGDGLLSYAEFHDARFDSILENGIPVRRENVTRIGERISPYEDPGDGHAPIIHSVEDFERVPASPERVRAYVRQMFDGQDRDGSGFIEVPEAPALLITQQARLQPDGTATYDPADPGRKLEGDAARRQYVANVDTDGDGKVSFDEYAVPVMPQFLRDGIPLIPADWTPAPPPGEREG